MLIYEGIFFEGKDADLIHALEDKQLENVNDNLHCTFKYRPNNSEIFNEIVGKTFEIYIVGYGNDGMNSGFEVLLPDELKKYYINYEEKEQNILRTPHITTSLSNGAKAVNTKNLKFNKLKKTVKITGKFGFWIQDKQRQYLSYKPYFKTKVK